MDTHGPVIPLILYLAAVFCLSWAWFMSAGWLIDPGNYGAWLAAGLTAFAAAHLPWTR